MFVNVSFLDATFVALLGLLTLVRVAWPKRYHVSLLCVGSAVLIGMGSVNTLIVMSAITLGFIYPLHRLIKRAADRQWPAVVARLLLPAGLGGLVALLVVFKIYNEFTLPWVGGRWINKDILAIVGFSYYIFRAISILRINSILKIDEPTPWVMLSYSLFPPTLTSGPIQRYQEFRSQALNPVPLTMPVVVAAVYRITRGFFRKLFVGTILSGSAQWLMGTPSLTPWVSLLIIVTLYLYFYFDFAGYSDIAIGFGLLLGIKVPENFRRPFVATSVSEFWRNWHITLVDFMREHVYIPFGGMRGSRRRAASLVFVIMVLVGLWHGLTLPFVIWGVWHGAWLALEALAGIGPISPANRRGLWYWGRVLRTNAIVAVASILFLPDTTTILRILRGLTNLWNFE